MIFDVWDFDVKSGRVGGSVGGRVANGVTMRMEEGWHGKMWYCYQVIG